MKLIKQAVKAEFLKLLTVRSTYGWLGLALLLVLFMSFYVQGIKAPGPFTDPNMLADVSSSAVNGVSGLIAVLSILLLTHEYRYNTIIYTLTATRRRGYVILAKIITVSCMALFVGLVISVLAPLMTALALQIRGAEVIHQVISPFDLLWRNLFTIWGFALLGLMFSMLLRGQVASIVVLFMLPSTIEPLLSVVLKEYASYLPFSALVAVSSGMRISHIAGAVTVMCWLVAGYILAWQLFIRRDAN